MPILTPIKEKQQIECPSAPSQAPPDASQANYYGSVPSLVFEQEDLDDDSNTDSDDDEPTLDVGDVVFLNKQLKLINDLHADLTESIKKETKKVRVALRAVRKAKQKINSLEDQSWAISSLLGRSDRSDYVGLQ